MAPDRADGVIGDVIAWFQHRGLPASWICEERVEPADLRARLMRFGCQPETAGVDMGSPLASLPYDAVPLPAGIRIDAVGRPSALEGWLAVADACGWFDGRADRDARRRLYESLGLEPHAPLRHYVARRDGRHVGMASAFFAGRTLLLAHVAVLQGERRHGIGRALAVHRLLEGRRAGCTTAVLAPSPDGAHLYRSLGFTASRTPAGRWFYLPLVPAERQRPTAASCRRAERGRAGRHDSGP